MSIDNILPQDVEIETVNKNEVNLLDLEDDFFLTDKQRKLKQKSLAEKDITKKT